jgi:hypothetical protein
LIGVSGAFQADHYFFLIWLGSKNAIGGTHFLYKKYIFKAPFKKKAAPKTHLLKKKRHQKRTFLKKQRMSFVFYTYNFNLIICN